MGSLNYVNGSWISCMCQAMFTYSKHLSNMSRNNVWKIVRLSLPLTLYHTIKLYAPIFSPFAMRRKCAPTYWNGPSPSQNQPRRLIPCNLEKAEESWSYWKTWGLSPTTHFECLQKTEKIWSPNVPSPLRLSKLQKQVGKLNELNNFVWKTYVCYCLKANIFLCR